MAHFTLVWLWQNFVGDMACDYRSFSIMEDPEDTGDTGDTEDRKARKPMGKYLDTTTSRLQRPGCLDENKTRCISTPVWIKFRRTFLGPSPALDAQLFCAPSKIAVEARRITLCG